MAHLRPSCVWHYLFSRAPDELSSPHVVSTCLALVSFLLLCVSARPLSYSRAPWQRFQIELSARVLNFLVVCSTSLLGLLAHSAGPLRGSSWLFLEGLPLAVDAYSVVALLLPRAA